MNIKYTKSYDNSIKKIKRHKYEYDNLEKIIKIIRDTRDFKELCSLPIVKKYHFERLKYDLNEFYSFNLCKSGGKIRPIIKPNDDNCVELFLVYISYNHYDDFNIKKVIYYE